MINLHSKIIVSVFLVLLLVSISASYYKYVYLADFILVTTIPCTEGKSCFAPECDSVDLDCSENYYRDNAYLKVNINASQAKSCLPDDLSCTGDICLKDEDSCKVISCDSTLDGNCIKL